MRIERTMRRALLALAAFVLLLAPGLAGAVDTTVNFDDLAAGTVVDSEYTARGVTFGPVVSGQAQATRALPRVTDVGAQAASGTRVGQVQRVCLTVECVGTPETWARFGSDMARVRVSVGGFGTVTNTLTLTAFDLNGVQVGQAQASVTGGAGFRTPVEISLPTRQIRTVRLRGSSLATFGLDDLFFSDLPTSLPEIAISASAGPYVLRRGQTVSVPVTLTRRNSSGTVRLTVRGLPTGVTATPTDHTLSSASGIASSHPLSVQLTASATAPPVVDAPATLAATPLTRAAGSAERTLPIRVRTLVLYDLRVSGIEVTQGVQEFGFASVTGSQSSSYAGVPLQANGRTIVRVYADNAGEDASVPGVSARLFGFDQTGAPLPGSPIFSESGSRTLTTVNPRGVAHPTRQERLDPSAAFTFTLPPSWTGRDPGLFRQATLVASFRAELGLPTQGVALRECTQAACAANDRFTHTGVTFTPTCCLVVVAAEITADGGGERPRDPRVALARALNITPVEIFLGGYRTQIDLTDALIPSTDGDPRMEIDRNVAFDRLEDFLARDGGDIAVGLGPTNHRMGSGRFPVAAFRDVRDRPLTFNGHEFQHGLGRDHASSSCGTQGDPWPPDEIGLIQGIGLDRTGTSPYRIFATPVDEPPSPGQRASGGIYDLMSYCATLGSDDPDSWISTRGWRELINAYRVDGTGPAELGLRSHHHPGHLARGSVVFQTGQPGLVVTGAEGPDGVRLLSVRPSAPRRLSGTTASGIRLVAKDAAGAVIGEVPVMARVSHVNLGGETTFLDAALEIDPARVQSLEFVRDGVVIAQRARSASAPRARFTSPRRGETVGRGRTVAIRWRATDADGDRLTTTVEWSPRGGRPGTWRPVSLGPNGGRVALPSDYFGGSASAVLRLRVNDGFNETVVVSPPFRTVHRGPTVRITSPAAGARVRRDGPLILTAQALDERGRAVPARRMRWLLGRRVVATGNGVVVDGLPAGRQLLLAQARDGAGRVGSAAVAVRVVAVAPQPVSVRAPARLSTTARRLRLRVASTLPASLTVSSPGARPSRAVVGRTPRTVTVAVAPAPGVLVLRLRLSADGRTSVSRLEIPRG